jgi:hypothetical protein
MPFVGRGEEIRRVADALTQGRHVILAGRYGMGRTALARQVRRRLAAELRLELCDFSRPPYDVCEELAGRLFGHHRPPGSPRPRLLTLRGEVLRRPPADPRPHALVLDDIARLTRPKEDLLRKLGERFRLVLVVESFLTAADRGRLEAWVHPAERVTLGRLPRAAVLEFFMVVAEGYGLSWEPSRVATLARASGGYPLRMRELAARELANPPDA